MVPDSTDYCHGCSTSTSSFISSMSAKWLTEALKARSDLSSRDHVLVMHRCLLDMLVDEELWATAGGHPRLCRVLVVPEKSR